MEKITRKQTLKLSIKGLWDVECDCINSRSLPFYLLCSKGTVTHSLYELKCCFILNITNIGMETSRGKAIKVKTILISASVQSTTPHKTFINITTTYTQSHGMAGFAKFFMFGKILKRDRLEHKHTFKTTDALLIFMKQIM